VQPQTTDARIKHTSPTPHPFSCSPPARAGKSLRVGPHNFCRAGSDSLSGVERLKLREGFYPIDGDCNPSAFVLGFFDSYYFSVTAH
jgi:hypothetical protein